MSSIFDWSTTAGNNATSDADINWSEGQFPSTVNDSARQMMGRQAEWLKDNGVLVASGTASAIAVTANSNVTTPPHGMSLAFRALSSNTGATTLSVNGGAGLTIRKAKPGSSAPVDLDANDIIAGGVYVVHYDSGANAGVGAWLLVNPVNAGYFTGEFVKKSGDTMTGNLTVSSATGGPNGSVTVGTGDTTHTGTIEFKTAASLRAAYIGFGTAGVVELRSENGFKWKVSGGMEVDNITATSLKANSPVNVIGDAYPSINIVGTDNNPRVEFIYDHTNGSLIVRLNGNVSRQFIYNSSDQIRLTGGGGLNPDGNIAGSVWSAWGASDAFNAISARIENRGGAYYNAAVGQIMPTIAAQSPNAVGTYALLKKKAGASASIGGFYAGSELQWSNANGDGTDGPSGTWKCMGQSVASGSSTPGAVTLYNKVAA